MKPKTQPLIISPYLLHIHKRIVDLTFSLLLFLITLPLQIIIGILILVSAGPPIIFSQKRLGRDHKIFYIYKFRTMIRGAPQQQWRYKDLNQADGPVFKIPHDPRFIGIGWFLARTGLDELPQLINVIKGNMSLVGPRPLPIEEAKKLPAKYSSRHLIRPGITSSWVISGSHSLSFSQWMHLDIQYQRHADFKQDLFILFSTLILILKVVFSSHQSPPIKKRQTSNH